jgi:hypothetical protein
VTEATLLLHVTDPGTDCGSIFQVDDAWTESGTDWTNAPPICGTALGTPGLVGLGAWVEVRLPASVPTAGNATCRIAVRSNNLQGGAGSYFCREGVAAPQRNAA